MECRVKPGPDGGSCRGVPVVLQPGITVTVLDCTVSHPDIGAGLPATMVL